MAKLKNPLLSLKASGSLARAITFVRRRGVDLVEKKPEIKDANTPAQQYHRNMFGLCVDLWHTLSAAEKKVWESAGTARHMTGYAWYISQCLRPNPGIYLPLAGGTMSGDILLASSRIRDLPAPAAPNDAARKAYVDLYHPTKEFFTSIVSFLDGGVWKPIDGATNRPSAPLTTNGDAAFMSFMVPQDFNAIVSAAILGAPYTTDPAADWDISSDYAAIGQNKDTHQESDNVTTYSVATNEIYALDISGILSSLSPGDLVGVRLDRRTISIRVYGIWFRYS